MSGGVDRAGLGEPGAAATTDSAPAALLTAWLGRASEALAAAGVAAPRADAELLAGFVLDLGRGELAAAAVRGTALTPPQTDRLEALLARRVAREPLQHITGRAPFRRLELLVGPGVFVPRPETELLAGWAIEALTALAAVDVAGAFDAAEPVEGINPKQREVAVPLVVDLCTGSGAVALAIADEAPAARVVALEREPEALGWARRNIAVQPAGARVDLRAGDVATAGDAVLAELLGQVDVVVANPPYIPPGAVPREVEVARHDPAAALYGGGDDGLAVPAQVVALAARLLRPGGTLLMEHGEHQGAATRALADRAPADQALAGAELWQAVTTRRDLTGRDRVLCAVRR